MTARTTRITLSGTRRRVDLAVDATTAVGLLVPDVLRVLDEPVGTAPDGFVLTLPDGRALDPEESLADAEVRDGTTVVLSPRTEAVGAAIVHDVSDAVATDLSARRGRWNATARRWTATVLLAVAVVATVLLVDRSRGLTAAVVVAAVVAVLGLAGRRTALRSLGVALVLAGGLALLATAPRLADAAAARLGIATVVVAVVGLLLAVVLRTLRAGLLWVGTLVVLGGVWALLQVAGASPAQAGGTTAVLGVLLLGLLPQLTVQLSGLARLDDRVVAGEEIPAVQADASLDTAHRGLAAGVVASAAAVAAGGAVAALTGNVWGVVLAVLLVVVGLLRSRTFPLTVSLVACLVAAVVVTAALLLRRLDDGGSPLAVAAVPVAVALLAALALGYRPPPQAGARARVLADRLEGVLVVALVPVLIGLGGFYGRLLDVFG